MKKCAIIMALIFMFLAGCGMANANLPQAQEQSWQKEEAASGWEIQYAVCEEPVYKVEIWEFPSDFKAMPLYVATLEMPQDIQEKWTSLLSKTEVPIAKFTTIGDSEGNREMVGKSFWVPEISGGWIQQFYYLSSPVGGGYSYSANNVSDLMSLASLTSEETPLYLVLSGDFLYGVIGDTAYYISDWNEENAPEYLPELYLGEGEVFVEKIDLH